MSFIYTTEDGEHHEFFLRYDEMKAKEIEPNVVITENGKRAYRDIATEQGGSRKLETWPVHCPASGVPPRDQARIRAELRKAGTDCEFDAKGRAIYTSKQHRNSVLKARGMADLDAGYGDHAPTSSDGSRQEETALGLNRRDFCRVWNQQLAEIKRRRGR